MLYWLPRVCVVAFAGLLIGFGFIPHTAVGVAHTLLIIVLVVLDETIVTRQVLLFRDFVLLILTPS